MVYWCVGILLILGFFFAFLPHPEYEARTSIIPEYEMQDNVGELLENYALLFGLTGNTKEKRTPSYLLELYPYMIKSLSFQRALIRKPFRYGKLNEDITLYDYFTKKPRPGLLSFIRKHTIGLPGTISQSLGSDSLSQVQPLVADSSVADSIVRSSASNAEFEILDLSSSEKKVIAQLQNRINAGYQRRTGIINIRAKMPEPELSAKTVQLILKVLRDKVITYKTAKARAYKAFLAEQQQKAKSELDEARQTLIAFKAGENQSLNRRMALQSRYQYALDRYGTLNEQVERINLTIQKQLPVFKVLNDISIPGHKSEPNRKLILAFSLLLGFLIAFSWITITFFISVLAQKPSS